MKIPLNEFEQLVEERILKRGLYYFKDNAIKDFLEISTGEYEAIVSGTEDYTVYLNIKNNTVVTHNCDCPYYMGPICKHVVAVIFYLQQDKLNLNEINRLKPINKKSKSVSQQVTELLKAISHKELIAFVKENSKKDKKFRNYFLASFDYLNQNQSKEFYQKQIFSILQAATGRDGWIDWSDMKYVVKTTQPFLENAAKHLDNNTFENVFFISTALLEEMTKALEYADDSNGDIVYFVEAAIELLLKLTQENLPKTLEEELFEYCISSFNKKQFTGYAWHLEMLHIASKLINNKKNVDVILSCLDTVDDSYEKERAQSFKLNLLKKFKDEKEVENYVNKHLSNRLIRTQTIENAFENNNFEKVKQLSKDGIKQDKIDRPGLVIGWYNWLLKVAQAEKDFPKIIEYSRLLFIANFHPEQDYYQILKDHIEAKNWHPFLEALIKEITPDQRWTYSALIRKIYIKEQWLDRLFLMLKQNLSFENIEQNEKYLTKDYADELIDFYSERIINYVEKFIGRNHYQKACRYLRRMKKLGGNEKVDALIVFFKKEYPNRPALMDELSRV